MFDKIIGFLTNSVEELQGIISKVEKVDNKTKEALEKYNNKVAKRGFVFGIPTGVLLTKAVEYILDLFK